MTHAQAVTFALDMAGATGVGASVTMMLVACDGGDAQDLLSSLRLFGIGVASLLLAHVRTSDSSSGNRSRLP